MTITIPKYSPSINIIRDENTHREYILTPNAQIAFNQIINNFKIGFKAFNLIGAYGTGKSSFLLALEKQLKKEKKVFNEENKSIQGYKQFKFVKIQGEYESFIKAFANCINIKGSINSIKHIFTEFNKTIISLQKQHIALVIIIDEFGKFLEYATKNNPEIEIYFIQQLCELINDSQKNVLLITSLHQDFTTYSFSLDNAQRNEWQKVKGRFKEITFNEPVEQLLLLASKRLSGIQKLQTNKNFSELFGLIRKSKVFPLKDYLNEEIAEALLPFDILSASILTLCLQKYAQNERSLFTFIESDDPFGLSEMNSDSSYFNVSNVYDYIYHNYQFFINSKYNPHFSNWATIRDCINRLDNLGKMSEGAVKIIKTIGLLNIFSVSNISYDFLIGYSKLSLQIKQTEQIIELLEKSKIIKYQKFNNKYILFEGTDLNIELAINEAGKIVPKVENVVGYLQNIFDFENILAKSVYYKVGTPRVFRFLLSDRPQIVIPDNYIDGFINLIFSEVALENEIKQFSKECKEAIIFAHYKNTKIISDLIFDIEKIKKVRNDNLHDRVAYKELSAICSHQENLLKHYVVENLYSSQTDVDWFFNGKKLTISSRKFLNKKLSDICNHVYFNTPVYQNELINKTKISGAISVARNNLLTNMLLNYTKKDFGFEEHKFPPEKTLYLTLLKFGGFHRTKNKTQYFLASPTEKTFLPIWEEFTRFIESCKQRKQSLSKIIDIYSQKPYKLKKGLIDLLVPIFLFIKRDDIAIFLDNTYLPELNEEIFDLMYKSPHKFEIKTFDINGIKFEIFNKCREYLDQQYRKKKEISNSSFIETIKPFLTFYRQLPEYSKNTTRLSLKAKLLREVIRNAKDPEKIFFEDFPQALGYTFNIKKKDNGSVEDFINDLKITVKEIRTSYENLVQRIYDFLCDYLFKEKMDFVMLRKLLIKRYSNIKEPLLLNYQKSFVNRMNSEINNINSWIASICQVLINKPLEQSLDSDEVLLYEKFEEIFYELDNLTEISKINFDSSKEEIIKIDVKTTDSPLSKNLIRYPKSKELEISELKSKLLKVLSNDRMVNRVALLKLFKDIN
ncbi:hypothetical protein [Flavobacterium filum]|uniref:hypothetical protein n=1 Tax=Flavobacterium filum TaxID=370974 RepID=UPI0023F3958E|nr:hypothetical protein [Flavobacterium filum]